MLSLNFPKRAASFTTIDGNPSVVSTPDGRFSMQAIFGSDGNIVLQRKIFCGGLFCNYHDDKLFVFSDGASLIQIYFLSNNEWTLTQGYKLKKVISSTNSEVQLLVSNQEVDGILTVSDSGQKSFESLFSSNGSRIIDVNPDGTIVESSKYDGELSWDSFSINQNGAVRNLLGCHRAIRSLPDGALIGETYDLEIGEYPEEGEICLALFQEGYVTPLFGPNGELVTLYTDQHLAIRDSLERLTIVGLCKVEDTDRLIPISWELENYYPGWGITGERLSDAMGSKCGFKIEMHHLD